MNAATEAKLRAGLTELGPGLYTMSDIAAACGVAESTVRRYRDELVTRGWLRYTSYVRYFSPSVREAEYETWRTAALWRQDARP